MSRPTDAAGAAEWVAAAFAAFAPHIKGLVLAATNDSGPRRGSDAGGIPPAAPRGAGRPVPDDDKRLALSDRHESRDQSEPPQCRRPTARCKPGPRWRRPATRSHRSRTRALAVHRHGARNAPGDRAVGTDDGWTGLRGRDIAARIGRSHGATRTMMCRARGRLRDILEAAEPSWTV